MRAKAKAMAFSLFFCHLPRHFGTRFWVDDMYLGSRNTTNHPMSGILQTYFTRGPLKNAMNVRQHDLKTAEMRESEDGEKNNVQNLPAKALQ